jgi:hypothetical protein
MIQDASPRSRVTDVDFFSSLIPDPEVKKAPDLGSGTLIQNKTADQTAANPNRLGYRNFLTMADSDLVRIRVKFFLRTT